MLLKRTPEIERFLAAPDPTLRAAVIHGRDVGLVRERATVLAGRISARPDDPFDVARVEEGELNPPSGRLEGELMAISMMGGRRLVRLKLAGELRDAETVAAEVLTAHLVGAFNPEAFFLIEAAPLRPASPLLRAAEKAELCAVIVCYEDEPGDLAALVRGGLAKEGLSLTSEALQEFVARLPHDRMLARGEIERLALYLGGPGRPPASWSDLDGFVGVEPEASLASAAIDAFGGRLGAAFTGLRRAEQEGRRGPAAVRAMGSHLARLRRAMVIQGGGASPQQAAKSAGVFWKNERDFLRQMRLWSRGELDGAQTDILTADEACKRAAAPDGAIAERLTLSIAGRARRLGM
ncbi:MAG: DNA polymerase III subunit delta [Caulobacteraceae bacterium]